MVYDARPGCCAMCGKAPSSDAKSPGSQGARGIVGVGTPTGFRRCAGCRQQDYCSEACQRKHWPSHRQQCKESRGTGEARDAGHPRAMGSKLPALEPARRRQVVANCVIADKLLANLQKRGVQRHASAVDGASQEALLHEATRQWERGQLKSAEHSLRCLAETEPKNLHAKVVLARMVTSQGMLQEAEVLLQDVLGQDPSYLGALEQYGVFLGRYLKEYELAEKLLRLAATIMPSKRLQVWPCVRCFVALDREPTCVFCSFVDASVPRQSPGTAFARTNSGKSALARAHTQTHKHTCTHARYCTCMRKGSPRSQVYVALPLAMLGPRRPFLLHHLSSAMELQSMGYSPVRLIQQRRYCSP